MLPGLACFLRHFADLGDLHATLIEHDHILVGPKGARAVGNGEDGDPVGQHADRRSALFSGFLSHYLILSGTEVVHM